ncbi:PQ loop repeat-domain-containing protein [Helicostylum pulchrum]|nr:PQ loop repeat-domain-containing protein [Helicostylum pulchrum]
MSSCRQLKENYKRQNGDGLSLTFLIIWLAGDLFNLAGIIMEKLMVTMFLLALWYTMADICLIWQVIYYKQTVTPNEPEMISLAMETVVERPKESVLWINIIGFITLISTTLISVYAYTVVPNDARDDSIRLMPQIMGWSSAILYVGSRLPQIIKNWRQQSTDGLSPGMFICAIFGNVFFTLSIFLKSTEPRYITVNLSWIIGSLGTVIFDFMIFLQFYVFNRRNLKRRAD